MGFESLIPSLASGIIKGIVGGSQRRQGKRLLDQLGEAPDLTIPTDVLENQTNARIAAQTGLPQEQYNNAMKNIQRQQLVALRGAQDRRSAGMLIPAIQDATNSATLNLDAKDAAARVANQKVLYGVNNQVGNWRKAIYENYMKTKFQPKQQYAMSLVGAGNANQMAGLDAGLSGLIPGLTGFGKKRGMGAGASGLLGGGGYDNPPIDPRLAQE